MLFCTTLEASESFHKQNSTSTSKLTHWLPGVFLTKSDDCHTGSKGFKGNKEMVPIWRIEVNSSQSKYLLDVY